MLTLSVEKIEALAASRKTYRKTCVVVRCPEGHEATLLPHCPAPPRRCVQPGCKARMSTRGANS